MFLLSVHARHIVIVLAQVWSRPIILLGIATLAAQRGDGFNDIAIAFDLSGQLERLSVHKASSTFVQLSFFFLCFPRTRPGRVTAVKGKKRKFFKKAKRSARK